jgi:hypothetical protein
MRVIRTKNRVSGKMRSWVGILLIVLATVPLPTMGGCALTRHPDGSFEVTLRPPTEAEVQALILLSQSLEASIARIEAEHRETQSQETAAKLERERERLEHITILLNAWRSRGVNVDEIKQKVENAS